MFFVLFCQNWCFCAVVVVEWLVCILLLFFEQMLEQTLPDGATNQLPEFLSMPCMVCVCVYVLDWTGDWVFTSTALVVVWTAVYLTGDNDYCFRRPISLPYKCDTSWKNSSVISEHNVNSKQSLGFSQLSQGWKLTKDFITSKLLFWNCTESPNCYLSMHNTANVNHLHTEITVCV